MRFMIMFRGETDEETTAPVCKESTDMRGLIAELKSAGILHSTEGLRPSARGARVRLSGGKLAVMDGPFAEAKELIAGYVIIEAGSKAEAVELSERFLRIAPEGSSAEVREILESPGAATTAFGEMPALQN
ncbi:MAG: YciI family protein [Gemmatimonadetes bacterium]|nr:YciI family protein [Gemmatimonadota bacterium]